MEGLKIFLIVFSVILFLYIVGVAVAVFYNNWNKKKRKIKGIPIGKCFSPFFLIAVFMAIVLEKVYSQRRISKYLKRKVQGKLSLSFLGLIPDHIMWQYGFRFAAPGCQYCYVNKVCEHEDCGCDARGKAFLPWEKCGGKQWGNIIVYKSNLTEDAKSMIDFAKKHYNLI